MWAFDIPWTPALFVAIIIATYLPSTYVFGIKPAKPHPFTRAARWAWRHAAALTRPRLACGHRASSVSRIAHPINGTRHRVATCNPCDIAVSLAPPTQHRPPARHRFTTITQQATTAITPVDGPASLVSHSQGG